VLGEETEMRLRRLHFAALALVALALAACGAEREDGNPFTGPNGNAVELPYGDGTSPARPQPPAEGP
jgi:hypothetical protein